MSEERIEPEPGFWEWLAAVACFTIGVLALATGFVLTTDRLLNAQLHPSLHAIGIVLLILGIPVIVLGGHFMDLGEKKNRHIVVVLMIVFLVTPTINAQQTIFNVPSTDVGGNHFFLLELGYNSIEACDVRFDFYSSDDRFLPDCARIRARV